MSTNALPIQTVVNISVANPPAGLADFKVNNLLLATKEAPTTPFNVGEDYRIYLTPSQVGADFGLTSETYQQAVLIFSQAPNILTGGGVLIIAPMAGGDTITTIFTKIAAEIFFGGMIIGGYTPADSEMINGAGTAQAAGVLLFLASNSTAELTSPGAFFTIHQANQSYARCLLYTVDAVSARLFAAAYAGLGMATDWEGSLTAATQQLKDLVGILPDPGITSTILNTCQTVGVDVYANIAGLPKLFSTGGNTFFDQVWGTEWLRLALQVAIFNALAQTSTKIPQTEQGVAVLRNAAIGVLEQGVRNGFIAPGSWNSPELFGNPDLLRSSIFNLGYYVYTQPVNQQAQTARAARQAPTMQIAVKLAGAIHTSSVIVFLNP